MVHCVNQGVTCYDFTKSCISFSQDHFFFSANSVNPDKILHHTAFHLGLQYLPNSYFGGTGIQCINREFIAKYFFLFYKLDNFLFYIYMVSTSCYQFDFFVLNIDIINFQCLIKFLTLSIIHNFP